MEPDSKHMEVAKNDKHSINIAIFLILVFLRAGCNNKLYKDKTLSLK